MSDLMLHGVLSMPLPDDPTELDLVTWVQFRERAQQASDRIEELEDKLAKALEDLEDIERRSRPMPQGDPKWINDHANTAIADIQDGAEG